MPSDNNQLPEPTVTKLYDVIGITGPQCVYPLRSGDAYKRKRKWTILVIKLKNNNLTITKPNKQKKTNHFCHEVAFENGLCKNLHIFGPQCVRNILITQTYSRPRKSHGNGFSRWVSYMPTLLWTTLVGNVNMDHNGLIKIRILNMSRQMVLASVPSTHWSREKMAAIFETTFSNAFSWMKMYKFRLRSHLSLFPRVHFIPILITEYVKKETLASVTLNCHSRYWFVI